MKQNGHAHLEPNDLCRVESEVYYPAIVNELRGLIGNPTNPLLRFTDSGTFEVVEPDWSLPADLGVPVRMVGVSYPGEMFSGRRLVKVGICGRCSTP